MKLNLRLPQHLAIIMDGNGRWAERLGRRRVYGHVKGANVARDIIEACSEFGISHLTLFTFSTENWRRPESEVRVLMELLFRRLKSELPVLMKNNIRFHCIGDLARMPKALQARARDVVLATRNNTGMKLTFALSYGGRQEILEAVRGLAMKIKVGELNPEEISEELFSSHLDSAFLPDPDFIIRTSGELRISNFFLWQAAYSELHFTTRLWPDFDRDDLLLALKDFDRRERRFGRTSLQLSHADPTN